MCLTVLQPFLCLADTCFVMALLACGVLCSVVLQTAFTDPSPSIHRKLSGNQSPNITERNTSTAINLRKGRTCNFKYVATFSAFVLLLLLASAAMFLCPLIPGMCWFAGGAPSASLLFHTYTRPGNLTFKNRRREETWWKSDGWGQESQANVGSPKL